jgi:hypothetical protein
MYKLISLDDSENGFYCAPRMLGTRPTASFFAPLGVLLALVATLQCKGKGEPETKTGPKLHLEILSLDTSAAPRDGRPFIAGEDARITLKVEGGQPPYDLQLATSLGMPTLVNASTRVETTIAEAIEVAMDLRLSSEVPSGSYGLLLRVTDQQGIGASVRSEPFEVKGNDTAQSPLDLSPLQFQILDIAGRRRDSFYQGEAIRLQARVEVGAQVSVAILAEDERAFMPMQRYEATSPIFVLDLRIPRLARIGSYRVQVSDAKSETSVPLRVIGTKFKDAKTPVLEELSLFGGKDQRVPRRASLLRAEPLRIEARVGGIKSRAQSSLRLRTRTGQVVARAELGEIVPSDLHPAARTLLSAAWTPRATLSRGRHTLEIEVIEGDELATIYREVVLR